MTQHYVTDTTFCKIQQWHERLFVEKANIHMVKYIHERRAIMTMLHRKSSLVAVLVAKSSALGVEDIPDPDIGPEAVDVDVGVESQSPAG